MLQQNINVSDNDMFNRTKDLSCFSFEQVPGVVLKYHCFPYPQHGVDFKSET